MSPAFADTSYKHFKAPLLLLPSELQNRWCRECLNLAIEIKRVVKICLTVETGLYRDATLLLKIAKEEYEKDNMYISDYYSKPKPSNLTKKQSDHYDDCKSYDYAVNKYLREKYQKREK